MGGAEADQARTKQEIGECDGREEGEEDWQWEMIGSSSASGGVGYIDLCWSKVNPA